MQTQLQHAFRKNLPEISWTHKAHCVSRVGRKPVRTLEVLQPADPAGCAPGVFLRRTSGGVLPHTATCAATQVLQVQVSQA